MKTTNQGTLGRPWLRPLLAASLAALALLALFAANGARQTHATASAMAITAGESDTCVLTSAGGVKCWGSDGYQTYGSLPVDISGLTSGVAAISAGQYHTCALTTGGGAKCWGRNDFGQLGDGTTTDRSAPVDVSGLTSGVAAISAGAAQTCAVTTGGAVKCWGENTSGELGDGTTNDSSKPVTALASGAAAVAAGYHHTCAITTAGGVKCWGYNNSGQLGDGSTTDRHTPVDVSGLGSGVASVSTGDLESCVVTTGGGGVKCWGANQLGQLGIGNNTGPDSCGGDPCAMTPQAVIGYGGSGVSQVSVGSFDACLVRSTGLAACWGWAQAGQLGFGTASGPDCSGKCLDAPAREANAGNTKTAVAAGWYHSCAIVSGGGVHCWGESVIGQMGDGTTTGQTLCSFGAFVNRPCDPTPVSTLLLGPTKPPATPALVPVTCPISPSQSFPNPGCDVLTVSGTLHADITSPIADTFTCPLSGPVQVARYHNPFAPYDGNNNGHRDTDIEIQYMTLVGYCTAVNTPGSFPIIVTQDPAQPSLGTLEEETANDPDFVPADALVNVHPFIHDVTNNRDIHTNSAVSMQCLGVTAVPITGCTFSFAGSFAGTPGGSAAAGPPPVALFDSTNTQIGSLTNASGTPVAIDSDLDGCSDAAEQQTAKGSQVSGGRRNPQNFWDFADMPNGSGIRDGKITVTDILAVVHRYGTDDANATAPVNRYADPLTIPPSVGYHPAFDRTAVGPNPWNLGPPDGRIRVADILAVVNQYSHHCP